VGKEAEDGNARKVEEVAFLAKVWGCALETAPPLASFEEGSEDKEEDGDAAAAWQAAGMISTPRIKATASTRRLWKARTHTYVMNRVLLV
jgi:hypothetical protein